MAELRRHGDWVGVGERETAEFLRDNLPADWIIDSNLQLPTNNHEDIDLLITGKNKLFVVEIKNWGPSIVLGAHYWQVVGHGKSPSQGDSRKSPLPLLAQKAKTAKSIISKAVGKNENIHKQRLVEGLLVLSRPGVTVLGSCPGDDAVVLPEQALLLLEAMDQEKTTDLAIHRDTVSLVISGLPAKSSDVSKLGDYIVKKPLSNLGIAKRFEAEHCMTGQPVILYCYPESKSEPELEFQNREREALQRLEQLARTWKLFPPFTAEEWGWNVWPQARPEGAKSLSELSVSDASNLFGEKALFGLVQELFEALAQIHEARVLHRALSPSRIWLGRSNRVFFSDFFSARLDDRQTLVAVPADPSSLAFAAPEVADDIHSATEASDVFSVAKLLLEWLGSQIDVNGNNPLQALPELRELLEKCSSEVKKERPKAAEAAQILRRRSADEVPAEGDSDDGASKDLVTPFSPGTELFGRYRIEASLGEGGASAAWRAFDKTEQKMVVIRSLKSEKAFQELTGPAPFKSVDAKNCQRHVHLEPKPSPGLHVVSYIEGETLEQKHSLAPFDVEDLRKIAANLFEGLHDAFHSKSLVHGDISARNVLVNDDLDVFFIDLASVANFGDTPKPATPAFLAPELRSGGGTCSSQSDIYSAGAVLIDLMLHRLPYEGSPRSETAGLKIMEPSEDELALWGSDGAALLKVLYRSVVPDVAQRPSHAREFARVIRLSRPPKVAALPAKDTRQIINPNVDHLRQLFVDSRRGNAGMLANGSEYSIATYVASRLDSDLVPRLIAGQHELVIISGNPGDGKTTFLEAVRAQLSENGAVTQESNQALWSGLLGETSFSFVFDASESFGDLSSEEVMAKALAPPEGSKSHVVVAAMNDGRLRQFVESFSATVPGLEEAWNGEVGLDSPVLIVDLKNRALVTDRDSGLGLDVIDSLLGPDLWEGSGCGDCASQGQCPIFRNVQFFRGDGKSGLQKLTLVSHLSSQRRATLRDFRSAVSFAVTGDIGCAEVHEGIGSGISPDSNPGYAAWNLVFESPDGRQLSDKLLSDWRRLDPGVAVDPTLVRQFVQESADLADGDYQAENLISEARKQFMVEPIASETNSNALGHYRYLGSFVRSVVDNHDGENLKNRLLLGLSKLTGVHLRHEGGLSVASSRLDPSWTLMKTVSEAEFVLSRNSPPESVVEALPSSLRLRHAGVGVTLDITVDLSELLMRAADGEMFGDDDSLPLRKQAQSFIDRLTQAQVDQATLLSPAGHSYPVVAKNGLIVLEKS